MQLSATCVALTEDDTTAFTGSKDGTLVRWDVESGKKLRLAVGGGSKPGDGKPRRKPSHASELLCCAVSSDARFLVGAGRDSTLKVWDLRTNVMVKSFTGHRGPVYGAAFRKGTAAVRVAVRCTAVDAESSTHVRARLTVRACVCMQLFTCGADRTVRHWNLDAMTFIDTLFGHTR